LRNGHFAEPADCYFHTMARRACADVALLTVRDHVLCLGVVRIIRFEDVFTDASVSHLFWNVAMSGTCPWHDGVSRRGAYTVMAWANIACAGVDLMISIAFVIGGFVLQHVSARAHRCSLKSR
jgi:hypothetical protein